MFGKVIMTVREIMDILSYDDVIKFSNGRYSLTAKDRSEILKIYNKLENAKRTPPKVVQEHSIVVLDSPHCEACYAIIRGGMPLFVYSFDEYVDMVIIDNTQGKYGDMPLEELFLIFLLSIRAQYASPDEKLPQPWDKYIFQCKTRWKEGN